MQALEDLGIPYLVLKGSALVLRYYRDKGVRSMRDFDAMVPERDLERAVHCAMKLSCDAENGLTPAAIVRRVRVGHVWQFSLGRDQSCDLHWRPVVRCYSPEITRMFLEASETVAFGNSTARVPAPTEQLFHICAHGLQWDWQPQIQWTADALAVLQEPAGWNRLAKLAAEARMQFRLARALDYLRREFAAEVPSDTVERLEAEAPDWERTEYRLLLRPCPLGFRDSVLWHVHHFRRIRSFDAGWRAKPAWIGFAEYLREFLGAESVPELCRRMWRELGARVLRGR